MEDHRIVRQRRLGRRVAHDVIIALARWGNHYTTREPFKTDADVKRAFARNGIDFDQLVDTCRDPAASVPFFENLIGSTWQVSSGASVACVNMQTGEESPSVQGPGSYAVDGYWATYELAHDALERAVDRASYTELLSAVVHGIAAIEGFISAAVIEWNKTHQDEALIDTKATKVTFDDKIDIWLPKMYGKKLEKGDPVWQHFKVLRRLRDDQAVHPKQAGFSVRYDELVRLVNIYRTGIAGMLLRLHILAGHRVPRVIIRDRYAPEAVRETIVTQNS